MPYFTFNFREQLFQAQYEVVPGDASTNYLITDLPENLAQMAEPSLLLPIIDGKIDAPSSELETAIADGLRQTLKGVHHF